MTEFKTNIVPFRAALLLAGCDDGATPSLVRARSLSRIRL